MKVLNVSMSRLDTTLQEYGGQTASEFAYLRSSQDNYTHHLDAKIEALGSNLSQTNKKLTAEVASIKTALNHTLKESFDANLSQINEHMTAELANVMSSLNGSLSQTSEQITAELANLKTSLNHTLKESFDASLPQINEYMTAELANVMSSLNHSLKGTLNASLSQTYKMSVELASLTTSLNHTLKETLNTSFCQTSEQMTAELANLMISLNHSLKETFDARLSQTNEELTTELANLTTSLKESYDASLPLIKERMTAELANLLTSLNHSLKGSFDASLSQTSEQLAELVNLQTSFDSAHSKLDSLTNATAQLSSDHQEIQANTCICQECTEMEVEPTTLATNDTCGGRGWRRVVYLDMTDPSTTCPSGWKLLAGSSERVCARATDARFSCDSTTFPVSGGEYSKVCGRIKGYQWGTPDAFYPFHSGQVVNIDRSYVDGVSVTHGTTRKHIWTFAVGFSEGRSTATFACPCDSIAVISIPSFVGEDYFCESGANSTYVRYTLHTSDPLWDGEGCLPRSSCCSRRNPPYFTKDLPAPTTDNIEARICLNERQYDENVAIELVELYVQ